MSDQSEPLLMDVGNTYVHWVLGERSGQFLSRHMPLALPAELNAILDSIKDVVLVSVRRTNVQEELVALAPTAQWHIAHTFPRSILSSDYDTERLGSDRWVGMLGAVALGLTEPGSAVCLIDAGTAVTIDVLRGRHHIGGWIMPGYRVWFDSLLKETDMGLNRPDSPAWALGASTNHAVANAWVSAVCAMVGLQKVEMPGLRVVVTGGDASRLAPWIPDALYIPDLIFQGLGFWNQHCKAIV